LQPFSPKVLVLFSLSKRADMNKVVCVEAHFQTWEEKGWLGGVTTKASDCRIDCQRLQRDVQSAMEDLKREGYEAVAITPITSGNYSWAQSGYSGYGYGYSFTEAVLITARYNHQLPARDV
jgi:hypothetical protein